MNVNDAVTHDCDNAIHAAVSNPPRDAVYNGVGRPDQYTINHAAYAIQPMMRYDPSLAAVSDA